jgi:hypothetical protein
MWCCCRRVVVYEMAPRNTVQNFEGVSFSTRFGKKSTIDIAHGACRSVGRSHTISLQMGYGLYVKLNRCYVRTSYGATYVCQHSLRPFQKKKCAESINPNRKQRMFGELGVVQFVLLISFCSSHFGAIYIFQYRSIHTYVKTNKFIYIFQSCQES